MTRTLKRCIVFALVFALCTALTATFTTTTVQAATKTHLKKTSITMTIGETYQQKLVTASGKTIAASKVKWSSNNSKIAKVSKSGKITAVKKGSVKLKAKYKGKTYSFKVKVGAASLNRTKWSFYIDDSQKLYLKSATGSKIAASKVHWISDNEAVAAVDEYGVITAKMTGETVIRATYKGHTYKCKCVVLGIRPPVMSSKISYDGSGKTTISWTSGYAADGYYVYCRSKDSSDWKMVGETSEELSYTVSSGSGVFYYAVAAYKKVEDDIVISERSNEIAGEWLAAPAPLISGVDGNGCTVSWGSISGASAYIVYTQKNNGNWQKWAETASTNVQLQFPNESATYRIKVVAAGIGATNRIFSKDSSVLTFTATSFEDVIAQERQRHNDQVEDIELRYKAQIKANEDMIKAVMSQLGVSYLYDASYYAQKAAPIKSEISAKERRVAYLNRDTSNANKLEIKRLEEEIKALLKEYTAILTLQQTAELKAQGEASAEIEKRDALALEERTHKNNVYSICAKYGVGNPDKYI